MATIVEGYHEEHAHPTGWRRYMFSTNHKDIGTIYLVFAVIAGLIGGALSIAMRAELADPRIEVFPTLARLLNHADPAQAVDAAKNPYNLFITAPGLIMIFFMGTPALNGGLG